MSNIKIFENREFGKVRTVLIGDIPMFVGKDITEILEYQNGSRDINRHVDEEDRLKAMIFDGNQDKETILINESGLYSLVLSSKMPKAKAFKRWVTSDVLPSIRKHGMYATDELLDNPDLFISVLEELKKERQEKLILKQQNLELKPKASYYDVVLNCKEAVAISVIAKDYGWSAKRMNQTLHELGIQFKQGKIWLLYQDYANKGYTCTKTYAYPKSNGDMGSRVHTYWTQKGRLFIYDLLKQEGYVPLVEMREAC